MMLRMLKGGTQQFHGGRGHWAVYYTSSQSFMIDNVFLFIGLINFGTFIIGWFIQLGVLAFQPLNEI